MEHLVSLERNIQTLYDEVLRPLAERTEFELPMSQKDAPGLPTVLFLGNHSSGKSSFINYLVESDVQKTGLAPTDDGFTIITYGDKKDEFDGQTVVTHPDLALKHLQELGPAFVSRLRLKTHPHPLLKSVTLIDSPGMIDAAGTSNTRDYDFSAAVRRLAEQADLILFFFDPDKPGTTGETVSIFTETLTGLNHKLMIILHKVDQFQNIRDFARTYATLCWNLAKTIKTKDIPQIYNTYVPNIGHTPANTGGKGGIPLQDFDASREELIEQIKRTPNRRVDNLVSDLYKNARRLATHIRVCNSVASEFRKRRLKWWTGIGATLGITLLVSWLLWSSETIPITLGVISLGILTAAGLWFASRSSLNRFRQEITTTEGLEPFFESTYRRELAMRDRADLRGWWESVRKQTVGTLRAIGPEKIPRAFLTWRSVKRLEKVVENDIPKLRRDIAEHHKILNQPPEPAGADNRSL